MKSTMHFRRNTILLFAFLYLQMQPAFELHAMPQIPSGGPSVHDDEILKAWFGAEHNQLVDASFESKEDNGGGMSTREFGAFTVTNLNDTDGDNGTYEDTNGNGIRDTGDNGTDTNNDGIPDISDLEDFDVRANGTYPTGFNPDDVTEKDLVKIEINEPTGWDPLKSHGRLRSYLRSYPTESAGIRFWVHKHKGVPYGVNDPEGDGIQFAPLVTSIDFSGVFGGSITLYAEVEHQSLDMSDQVLIV